MERRAEPIFSTLADDPASADAIDRFVIGLAERVDELQDLDLRNELSELAPRVAELGSEALKVGFDTLARCAYAVEDACREDARRDVHKGLLELTDIARRVRLGHRGSA